MKQTWNELITKAKQNDQNALSDLYQNSYDAVYRTVKSMVRDEDAVLDIVQDAFIKGFSSLSSLENPDQFVPWMNRIATNKAKDWFKKKREVTFSQLTDEEGNEPEFADDRTENLPENVIDRQETARLINEILATLSDDQRIAIGMYYYQNLSVKEIAQELGVSENTVKGHLRYGRDKIRAGVLSLEKRGTKLYGLSPIPFLLWLFRNQKAQLSVGNAPAALFGKIAAKTAESAASASSASAAAGAAAGKTGGLFASLGAKIAAGVLAAAIVGGGVIAAVQLSSRNADSDTPNAGTTEAESSGSMPDLEDNAISGPSEGLEFELDDSGRFYIVCGIGSCTDTKIVIPETYNGMSVWKIAERAFSEERILSVVIPESVVSIGAYAFKNCTSLTDVAIPDSVSIMGMYAFEGCTGLTSVTISTTGLCTFEGCTGLTSVTIPDNVTRIGAGAFKGCTGLTSITIPDSVTDIEAGAFEDCTGLTSVTIPDSVTSIGGSAFYGCTGLTSITIPDSVTDIGDFAFYGCTGLTSVTIPVGVSTTGYGVFQGCTGLTDVTISDGVVYISQQIFKDCTDLTSITIPDSVTSIGAYAFEGCTGLTSVTIPDSVTSIDAAAFEGCTGLTSVTIPDGVTRISACAFRFCESLITIAIPDSVTEIDQYAFEGCTGLTSIIIPDSVTDIGECVFDDCANLTDINYTGTMEEWHRISKDRRWDSGLWDLDRKVPHYTVHCTDGDIPK